MPKALTPRFELLRGLTDLLAELARVFLKLCGLKFGRPAAIKTSWNILRIGVAVLQCARSSPAASNWREGPNATQVDRKIGSSLPHSFSSRRYETQSAIILRISSPTGKKRCWMIYWTSSLLPVHPDWHNQQWDRHVLASLKQWRCLSHPS